MKKILIVDDDLQVANSLKFKLEDTGFEVDIVHSISAAKETLATPHEIGVILSDTHLTGTERGFHAVTHYRALNIPVIGMSSFFLAAHQWIAVGVHNFFDKMTMDNADEWKRLTDTLRKLLA